MLAFGGAMIVVGLATYGYNIMSVIGKQNSRESDRCKGVG
jgi:sodium-dependent phosphate transporter